MREPADPTSPPAADDAPVAAADPPAAVTAPPAAVTAPPTATDGPVVVVVAADLAVEPLLPPSLSDADLRAALAGRPAAAAKAPPAPAAAGHRPRPAPAAPTAAARPAARAPRRDRDDERDRDDDPEARPRRSRRAMMIGLGTLILGLLIATFIFLGHANHDRYLITCQPDAIVAEQGRSFPPWGSRPLEGTPWVPIKLPAKAECKPRETEEPRELAGWYLDAIVDQASTSLSVTDVSRADADVADLQLKQALLLAREPERRDQRKDIERLLGDVAYWRAKDQLRTATTALTEAAKQFDAAATARPRHVDDAGAWASYVRRLGEQLTLGPNGKPAAGAPIPAERPLAPPGVALPVEPSDGGAAPPAIIPIDAGVPAGGVLL